MHSLVPRESATRMSEAPTSCCTVSPVTVKSFSTDCRPSSYGSSKKIAAQAACVCRSSWFIFGYVIVDLRVSALIYTAKIASRYAMCMRKHYCNVFPC